MTKGDRERGWAEEPVRQWGGYFVKRVHATKSGGEHSSGNERANWQIGQSRWQMNDVGLPTELLHCGLQQRAPEAGLPCKPGRSHPWAEARCCRCCATAGRYCCLVGHHAVLGIQLSLELLQGLVCRGRQTGSGESRSVEQQRGVRRSARAL